MEPLFLGLVGSMILIVGAAMPAKNAVHPAKEPKNLIFAAGNLCMFAYAVMHYLHGASIFFVILQVLIALTTVLMLLDTSDTFDIPVIAAASAGLIAYSLYLSHSIQTLVFVIGLAALGMGFALDTGSHKRNMALGLGSAIIAGFSYLQADWVFFGLNFFFAVFSFRYAWRLKTAVKR